MPRPVAELHARPLPSAADLTLPPAMAPAGLFAMQGR